MLVVQVCPMVLFFLELTRTFRTLTDSIYTQCVICSLFGVVKFIISAARNAHITVHLLTAY